MVYCLASSLYIIEKGNVIIIIEQLKLKSLHCCPLFETHTHTYAHTHVYIMYVCVYVFMYLERHYSQTFPDSLRSIYTFFTILSFSAICYNSFNSNNFAVDFLEDNDLSYMPNIFGSRPTSNNIHPNS